MWNSAMFLWSGWGKVKKGNVHLETHNQMKTDLIICLGRVISTGEFHLEGERTCGGKAFPIFPLQRQETLKVKSWFWAFTMSSWSPCSWSWSVLVIASPCSSESSGSPSPWPSPRLCSTICFSSSFNFLARTISFPPTFRFSVLTSLWETFSSFLSRSRSFLQSEMAFSQLPGSSFISLWSSVSIFPK